MLARSVDDAALLALVLCGRGDDALPSAQAAAPRVGVTLTSRAAAVSSDMATTLAKCALRLAAAGAVVHDARWPASFDALFDAQRTVQAFETARALAPEWQYRREQLSAPLAAFIEEGLGIDGAAYAAALAAADGRRRLHALLFDRCDVLIVPSAPGVAPSLAQGSTGDPLFSRPWQLLGWAASTCRWRATPTAYRSGCSWSAGPATMPGCWPRRRGSRRCWWRGGGSDRS